MQDQYAGDISDYAKLSLLRRFGDAKLKIGVNWYYVDHSEVDGKAKPRRETGYLGCSGTDYRSCCPDVFDKIKNRFAQEGTRGQMTLKDIQKTAQSCGRSVSFYDRQLSYVGAGTLAKKVEARETWFGNSLPTLQGQDVVFLDPDNGFEVRSVSRGSRKCLKYAQYQEVAAHLARGQGVILIQFHSPRDNDEYRNRKFKESIDRAAMWTGRRPWTIEFDGATKLSFLLFESPAAGCCVSRKIRRALASLPPKFFAVKRPAK